MQLLVRKRKASENISTSLNYAEPISLNFFSYHMTMLNLELIRERHAVSLVAQVKNTGKHEEMMIGKNFKLQYEEHGATPDVCFVSSDKALKVMKGWKILQPGERCTCHLSFKISPNFPYYDISYSYHNYLFFLCRMQEKPGLK